MRAVRFVRLIVGLVVLVAVMAFGAASASAFSLSSSTASTQAGAPTNMSFTYVATGTQSVSRLDVDLPPGMMHDPSATPACPLATFQADRCPATSRVATAATTIVVGATQLSVPGAVFHVADAADDSDFPLGIVLRPPLSALGLTGKIFLRDRVSFTNGGGLRHSIAVPRVDVSVLGLPLRGRLQRMSLSFTGQNSNGNQLYNSTAAISQPYRANATFTDGSSETRTAPYRTTGSDKLIFTGGFDIDEATARATQPSTFGAKLGGAAKAPAGVTHEYHRVGGKLDVTNFGEWDDSSLVSGPACTDGEVATGNCPESARIGRVSFGIEGFPGTRTGSIFNSFPRGAKPRGAVRIGSTAVVTFTVDLVTGADGRATFEVDGLPQLPLTDIDIDIDAPVFVPKGKPASCSNREARGVIFGHSGGQTNTTAKYPPLACPPSVSFADAGDADSDGDGLADKSLKPENFHVWYDVANGGNGIDESSITCSVQPTDAARPGRGKVKNVKDTGGSARNGCEVTEAGGDITVAFSVASIDGHVTVLKSAYNVDSEAPVLESVAPEPIESTSTSIALPFEFTDDRIDHPQAAYDIECVIEDSSGQRHTTTPGHKYIDTLKRSGGGECMWDTGRSGRFRLEIVVRDSGGHVTVLKRTATVDAQGPTITVTDFRDADKDQDGRADDELRRTSFAVLFSTTDEFAVDNGSISCKLIVPVAMDKGLRVADTDGDGAPDVCLVEDAPGGPVSVEISAADWRGHVTVLKIGFTVDSDDPVVTGLDRGFYSIPQVDDEFEFTDDTMTHPQSDYAAECRVAGPKLEGGKEGLARVVVDRDSGRSKGFCSIGELPDGEYELSLRVRDKVGHVTLIKRTIFVDTTGPVITLTDPRDADSDDDGLADDELRAEDFTVPFLVTDASGKGGNKISCNAVFTNPLSSINVNSGDTQGDGPGECVIEDATTGPLTVTITAVDWRGHVTVLKMSYTVDAEPPVIETTAPDKVVYDISTFDFEFEFTDDTASHPQSKFKAGAEIEIKTGLLTSEAKIVTDRDTGRSKGFARFENVPDGSYELVLRVRDKVGHVTLIKRTILVDTTPPRLIVGDEQCDDDNTDPRDGCSRAANFEVDVSASDDGSGVESVECRKGPRGWDGTVKGSTRLVDVDGDGAADVCVVEDAPEGVVDIEFVARDKVGHVTLIKRTFSVDRTGPGIAMNPLYSSDNTGFDRVFTTPSFDLPFTVTDASGVDAATVSCTVRGWDYTTKTRVAVADTDGDGMPDVCRIVEAPDGLFELEISAADVHGHVTVLKLAGEVDAIPPVLTILSPTSGQSFSYGGTMRPVHTIEGTGPYTFSCRIDGVVVASSCPSSTSISLTGIAAGAHVLSVTARDDSGRSSIGTVSFTISSPPTGGTTVCPITSNIPGCPYGPITCVAIYPAPPGCPGGPPTTACPPPQYVNPPLGCPIYGTPGGGIITVP